MENEQNNNNNQIPEFQNIGNNNQQGHTHGAHPYVEHHHHKCGLHARREPSMCTEKYCAQKILCKALKILFALGIAFIIFVSGIAVGAHIGHRRSNTDSYRIHQMPNIERGIRNSYPAQQYEIQIEPGYHQNQKEYFFKFGN